METTMDSALNSNRETMYRFLGRLYKIEVDQLLLDQMKGTSFPSGDSAGELGEGYRMLEQYLRHPGPDPLTDLAVDYAKVFLGAGIYKDSGAAYPYESVYTSPERIIMQDARDQVMALYRAKGLGKAETWDFPEDHIALELEFMACLCSETQQAIDRQEGRAALACLREQQDFLTGHLLNWVPAFCADIRKFAGTVFYQAAAQITHGYLDLDHTLLKDMMAEPAGRS